MTLRIHFAGLVPGRPLVHIAWAAFSHNERLTSTTIVHFGREAADVFDRHWSIASTLEDCDVVVYPHTYEDGPEPATVAEAARRAGKPCLFFSQDERLPPSRLAYGTLYRSSIFERLPHERCHPVFINDVRSETSGTYPDVLAKETIPQVGFCGYVGTLIGRTVLRLINARQKVEGLAFRAKVLKLLASDRRIRCDFICRGSYLGASTLAAIDKTHPLAGAREAFLRNLFTCPYSLAMRGKGNHSVRFYEILAAGRIPVFVNTKCVLPLEDEIDWKSLTVWIEDNELSMIGDRLLDFHNHTDVDTFADIQRKTRHVWETQLTPEPWFRHVLHTVASGARAP